MKWNELEEERCSIARTVSVIGDRWTLLVLRDCFLGVRRFDEFLGRLGISRPMLSDRLARLVEAGVLKKVAYQEAPVRHEYRLTSKGLDLHPWSWPSCTGAMCTCPARKAGPCCTGIRCAATRSIP